MAPDSKCMAALAVVCLWGCGAPTPPGPDAGAPDAGSLTQAFAHGELTSSLRARVAGAGLRLLQRHGTVYLLEVARDETGRESRRLVATREGATLWALDEAPGERFTDFTLHPSGELTLGIERRAAVRDGYDLVRLDGLGRELSRQVLAAPSTIPAGDLSPGLSPSVFLMKGVMDTSTIRGWLPWLRLEARGENLAIGLLTYAERPDAGPSDTDVISAVMALDWNGGHYTERWSRTVDGSHSLIAVAWQYDEFLWLDAASRLLLAVGPDGSVVVGRTLGASRCNAIVDRFGEVGMKRCREIRANGTAHRYQPFAWTSFSPDGARLGTQVLAPPALEDFLVFDMAVRDETVAVAGAAVRLGASGSPDYYFEPPNHTAGTPLLPFDGYLATLDRQSGSLLHQTFVDQGRGDLLAAVRWTPEGLAAAGATDWNRWHGGMSISRGAEPLLVLDPADGGSVLRRTLPVADDARHAHLLCLDTQGAQLWAGGPYDAPMTHSGDLDVAPMALGGLTVQLR